MLKIFVSLTGAHENLTASIRQCAALNNSSGNRGSLSITEFSLKSKVWSLKSKLFSDSRLLINEASQLHTDGKPDGDERCQDGRKPRTH